MEKFTLREVCNRVGVSRRAIQGYEKIGLVVSSGKNKYGYLLYDETEVEKISCIKQYQHFGFKVKEIVVLMIAPDDIYIEMLSKKMEIMKKQVKNLMVNIEMAENCWLKGNNNKNDM